MAAKGAWFERAGAGVARALIAALRALDPVRCSNLGGGLARAVGPWLGVSRVAEANLRLALPELDAAGRAAVIAGVWENLGRTAAELPHLAAFQRSAAGIGWELAGEEHLAGLQGGQAIFFSGHFGNWELILPVAASLGLRVAGIYRAASNAAMDAVIQDMRAAALGPEIRMFPKGTAGAKGAMLHLRGGGSLGLLVDQKMNDGIAATFFGRKAMTAPALALFARHFRIPVIPVHVVRLGPARFRMVCEAPLALRWSDDRDGDISRATQMVNDTLERWVRESPSSWLWLHRRWPPPG